MLSADTMHTALTYTMYDIAGSLWGTLVFAAVMLPPGYLIGWFTQLAGFRKRSLAEQLAWSVSLSLGAGTIIIVALTWLAGIAITVALLVLVGVLAIVIFSRGASAAGIRIRPLYLLLFLGWTALVVLSLVDLGAGSRLLMSVTTFDHSVRVPFVDAVMRTGVVPVNPLYWPGHDAPLRYYYFWYVTCGLIAKLAHISARQALIASCVWPPIAVAAMLALYGKYVLGWQGTRLRSRMKLAVAFMAVTGLDVLIAIFSGLAGGVQNGDMEWWSVDQVSSWIDSFLWVPHHVAALVCCLLTFLLIWHSREVDSKRQRFLLAALAGLSFASAFGLSSFVAIGFCLVTLSWLVRVLATTRDRCQLVATLTASLVAAAALTPYLMQLLHQTPVNGARGSAAHILSFEVRRMLVTDMLAKAPFVARLAGHSPFLQEQIAALLLLLPGYCIELGFFALVLWRFYRLPAKTEGERTVLYLAGSALLSVSVLRSTVIATNDYGVRATLLAQFFLLLLAVRVWEDSLQRTPATRRTFLRGLAFIGVAGSVYQTINLRLYLPRQQARGNPLMRELAEREYAMRDAYAQLDKLIPIDARIQYGAPATGYFDYTHTLNAARQIVAAGTTGNDCNTGFGGEVSACAPIRKAGAQLYTPGARLQPSAAAGLCRQLGAQYLVATRWDTVWQDSSAWPWILPAVVATPSVRIVACSPKQGVPPA